jgi:hypothetical protein
MMNERQHAFHHSSFVFILLILSIPVNFLSAKLARLDFGENPLATARGTVPVP